MERLLLSSISDPEKHIQCTGKCIALESGVALHRAIQTTLFKALRNIVGPTLRWFGPVPQQRLDKLPLNWLLVASVPGGAFLMILLIT